MERRCLPFIDERHLERIGFGFKGAIVGGESRNLGEQRRGRKVRNARLFARSRELSHRSVSILPRVFVERGKKEGRRGGGARGKDRKKKKKERPRFNAKASCRKDLSAAYFPGHVRTFSISVERFFVPFLLPLSLSLLDPWKMADESGEAEGGKVGEREREREKGNAKFSSKASTRWIRFPSFSTSLVNELWSAVCAYVT